MTLEDDTGTRTCDRCVTKLPTRWSHRIVQTSHPVTCIKSPKKWTVQLRLLILEHMKKLSQGEVGSFLRNLSVNFSVFFGYGCSLVYQLDSFDPGNNPHQVGYNLQNCGSHCCMCSVYIYIYIYMCVCVQICIYIYTYIDIYVYICCAGFDVSCYKTI